MSRILRQYLANTLLVVLMVLYSASLIGALFISPAAMLFGVLGFGLMFAVGLLLRGFRLKEIRSQRMWKVVGVGFVALFLTSILFSVRGAPDPGGLPIFAAREKYLFTSGIEVSRARFLIVATSFYLAWHSFAMAGAVELWSQVRTRTLKQSETRKSR